MSGLTGAEASEWRNYVGDRLALNGIEILDPLRNLKYVTANAAIDADGAVLSIDEALLTDRGINIRDYNDTVTSDLLFVNLLGARRVSIGTVIELAWAWERRIPIVVVMDSGNVHDHAMLRDMISYRVDTLDRGIRVALSVLNRYRYVA